MEKEILSEVLLEQQIEIVNLKIVIKELENQLAKKEDKDANRGKVSHSSK